MKEAEGLIGEIEELEIELKAEQKINENKTEIYIGGNKMSVLTKTGTELIKAPEYYNAYFKRLMSVPLSSNEQKMIQHGIDYKFLQVGTNPSGNQDATPAVPEQTMNTIIAKNIQLNFLKSSSST